MALINISGTDWITFALVVFFGLFTVVEAVIAWKAYRRPATKIRAGFWEVERHDRYMRVVAPVMISPGGSSFVVVDTKCELRWEGGKVRLEPRHGHLDQVYQGGHRLNFEFAEHERSDFGSRPPPKAFDVEVWIKLLDGAQLHERQPSVPLTRDAIHLLASYDEPDRNPPQMARVAAIRVRQWAGKTWNRTPIMKAWRNLRHS